jgi:hypothetical protein
VSDLHFCTSVFFSAASSSAMCVETFLGRFAVLAS